MRFILPVVLSFVICIGMFFGMHIMTNSNSNHFEQQQKTPHLVYLREKRDTKIERKKRIQPKKEVKKKPEKLKLTKKFHTKPDKNVKIMPVKLQQKIEISKINSLNGAQILLDANALNALKRVNPKYPRRAKLKKQEGHVKLMFVIAEDGYVYNVKVLESNPPGAFEKSALRAIKRWQFRRSAHAKNATITFNYRLAQ